jgi:hypothetical protein
MQFAPLMISVPIVNLITYAAIWVISGWYNAVVVCALAIVTSVIQYYTALRQRTLQGEISSNTDDRLKLVSDMI